MEFIRFGKLGRLGGLGAGVGSLMKWIQILTTTQTASNVQIPLTILIDSGKKVKIDWGNGTIVEVIGTGAEVVYASNYSEAGTFNIKFFGDTAFIRTFKIISTNAVMTLPYGIANWKKLTGLTTLDLSNLANFTSTGVHADIPRVTNTLSLYNLPNFTSTGVHADIPRVTNTLTLSNLANFTSTGVHADIPRVTNTLSLYNLANFTSTGNHIDLPRVTDTLYLYALPNFTSTGNHIDLPRVTNYMRLYALPNFTSTGNHIDLPRVTNTLSLYALPNFTSTGNISTIPNVTTALYITLCPLVSITVDTPPTWTTTTITLQVGWSTANVDLFIVNWAQVTGTSTKTVNIAGNNGLVSTGDSAVAAALVVLQNKLKTMLYNY